MESIKTNRTWGKPSLVQHIEEHDSVYEVYVKRWSDIFSEFELRHKFLLDRLNFKRNSLTANYSNLADLHKIVSDSNE